MMHVRTSSGTSVSRGKPKHTVLYPDGLAWQIPQGIMVSGYSDIVQPFPDAGAIPSGDVTLYMPFPPPKLTAAHGTETELLSRGVRNSAVMLFDACPVTNLNPRTSSAKRTDAALKVLSSSTGKMESQISVPICEPETRMLPPSETNALMADCIAAGKTLYFSALPFFPVRVATCSPQMMSAAKNPPPDMLSPVHVRVLSEEKASALAEQKGYPAAIIALPCVYA